MKLKITKLILLLLMTLLYTSVLYSQNEISNVWVADNGNITYKNPTIHADYSDPDAIRVGDDFYMTSSSFNCIPDLPILHSNDLANWESIGYTITKSYDFVVAQDGTGTFKTIQEAINAVPDFRKNKTTIFIKNGIYKEKLILPASKTNVSFIGEDIEKTILTYDDFASKKNRFGEEVGTTGSTTFYVFSEGFTAENMTFENSAGPVGQAVAVRIDGNKVAFKNCRFLGFQDTLYPHGNKSHQYYKNCYIEGTVDFIFGWSTAVFDECTIFCKEHGYITAPSTLEETPYGFVFLKCKITGTAPEESFYLGRPWRPFGKTVFIECELGKHINPEGWHNWNDTDKEKTAFFAEYNNSGAGANKEQRVKWSHQLTKEQAKSYSPENILGEWVKNPKLFYTEK